MSHGRVLGTSIVAALGLLAASLQAAVELRGRILPSEGGGSAINVKITIKSLSTPEEVGRIRSLIEARDEKALRAAFKAADKATFQYIGSSGTNVKFGLATEIPTDHGSRYVLVNCQNALSSRPGIGWEFVVAVLDVRLNEESEGRIYDAATVKFSTQGGFDLDRFFVDPISIVNLRRTK